MEQTLDNSFIYFINLARLSSYELSAISASNMVIYRYLILKIIIEIFFRDYLTSNQSLEFLSFSWQVLAKSSRKGIETSSNKEKMRNVAVSIDTSN